MHKLMVTVDNFSFAGKKALIRVDFNVPLDEAYHITDTTRIDEALPTIRKILADGGSVVLMSHLGRPKDGPQEKYSLAHLTPYLSGVLRTAVHFAGDCIGETTEKAAAALQPGEVLLLENLRFHKEETKGDAAFAEKLARLGDIYVNDAFGTAHRAHASTAVIAQFFGGRKCFGYLMASEIEHIGRVNSDPQKPFVAILGGAKVSDKLAIIENLLPKTDRILIGGGMMFTFIKARGGRIGQSLCENDMVDTCRNLLAVAHRNFGDAAANLGRNRYLVHLDIGIVGRDVAAGGQIEIAGDRGKQQRYAELGEPGGGNLPCDGDRQGQQDGPDR